MINSRRRRLASDEAHAWARNLRLYNPLAKLLLCMLAGYVNGDGECWVGLNALAEDCDCDRKTIVNRLNFLQSRGLIIRKRQWLSLGGDRNSEGRGKPTTDLIKLEIDVEDISTTDVKEVSGPIGTESGPPAVRQPSASVGIQAGSVNEPEPEIRKTRVRARAEGRAPARQEVEDPIQFVCHGTRQWRALVALDPHGMARKPVKRGVGQHANHTGWYFPRSLIQKALDDVAVARGPPVDDDPDVIADRDESANCQDEETSTGEGDDASSGQFASGLQSVSRALECR